MPPIALTEEQVVILDSFFDKIQVLRTISSLCCVFYSYDSRKHNIKIRISSIGTYRTMGPYDFSGTIRNDYNVSSHHNEQGVHFSRSL